MKKIHVTRLVFIILMLILAGVWVTRLTKPKVPTEKPVERPIKELIDVLEETKAPEITWKEATSFKDLSGWETADLRPSFKTFIVSCEVFVRQSPEREVGTKAVPLQVKDWLPVCRAAPKLSKHTKTGANFSMAP